MLSETGMVSRRTLTRSLLAAAVVGGVSGCARVVPQGLGLALTPSPLTDGPVYNFALNLEYLEAEYYARGVNGSGLPDELLGPRPRGVTGGRQVNFQTAYIREFMAEIAEDERNHVRYLRSHIRKRLLGEMSRPQIDLTAAFRAAGSAAGLGDNFDPFADEQSFLLGAFLFEDVGVTAYTGAAKRLSNADFVEDAAGILAVEAYHAGLVRAQLAEMGPAAVNAANAITVARDKLDGDTVNETPLTEGDRINISATDAQGRAYPRSVQQVLNVVYLTPGKHQKGGGFFPEGFNGVVRFSEIDSDPNVRTA